MDLTSTLETLNSSIAEATDCQQLDVFADRLRRLAEVAELKAQGKQWVGPLFRAAKQANAEMQ